MNEKSNFIKTIIKEDISNKKYDKIITRFPPEPNGYLHIGHAKAIVTSFELAKEFNGETNLRFDDTNPLKESVEYVESIKKDVEWLGYTPKNIFFASNYFDYMYDKAVLLIKKDKAFVCDLSAEEIREYHGDLVKGGKESPYRNRTVEENLDLFEKMKSGKFQNGEKVLRAKIDMSSPNMNMRDPVIYRISHTHHHNTNDKWCIYPMYDFAHSLEDALEGITHSLCSLEFENHRPLYDWVVKECETESIPRQIEFARLNVSNTIMSKRYLKKLIDNKLVDGWDDPRLPTISGLRRRGFTPDGIRNFILESGLSKVNSTSDVEYLEHFIRQDLMKKVPVIMAVVNPLKVIITNLDDNHKEYVKGSNHPKDESFGEREIAFTKEIYIEKEDFVIDKPNNKYKRASIGNEVRLRHAYFIKPYKYDVSDSGDITCVYATYDVDTKSGSGFKDRKPDGTIHFVSASENAPCKINLINNLIEEEFNNDNFLKKINKDSIIICDGFIEKSYLESKYKSYQFIRNGYFTEDTYSTSDKLVFNRTVKIKSSKKIIHN